MPANVAEALPTAPDGSVRDLTVLGREVRNGRETYRLRHEATSEPLFCGLVKRQAPDSVATSALEQLAADPTPAAAMPAALTSYETVCLVATADPAMANPLDLAVDNDDGGVNEKAPRHENAAAAPTDAVEWASVDRGVPMLLDKNTRARFEARLLGAFDERPSSASALFETLLPPDVIGRIVDATAARMGSKLGKEEFMAFLGAMLICASDARPRAELWKSGHELRPTPALSKYMSRRRFDTIASAVSLARGAGDLPAVRQLVSRFNDHMLSVFRPSDTVGLDEDMLKRTSAAMPARSYVPLTLAPSGDEYRALVDQDSCVLFRMELIEDPDREPTLLRPAFEDECGKSDSVLLRMAEPLHGTGSVIAIDNDCCVVDTIMDLAAKGVYAVAPVEKRQRWPRHLTDMDAVTAHTAQQPVGTLVAREGTWRPSSRKLGHFAVNYGKSVRSLISTYGSHHCGRQMAHVRSNGQVIEFQRNAPFEDHYAARFAVDLHNTLHRAQRGDLERAWASRRWQVRQLALVLSVTVVNAFLIGNKFGLVTSANINEFRFQLASELLRAWRKRKKASRKGKRTSTGGEGRLPRLLMHEGGQAAKRAKKRQQEQPEDIHGCQLFQPHREAFMHPPFDRQDKTGGRVTATMAVPKQRRGRRAEHTINPADASEPNGPEAGQRQRWAWYGLFGLLAVGCLLLGVGRNDDKGIRAKDMHSVMANAPAYADVPVRSSIKSLEQLLAAIRNAKAPQVLRTELVNGWPARHWTLPQWQQHLGHIHGGYAHDAHPLFGPYYDSSKPLAPWAHPINNYSDTWHGPADALLQSTVADPIAKPPFLYLSQELEQLPIDLYPALPGLEALLVLAPERSSINLWLGQPGVTAHCHYAVIITSTPSSWTQNVLAHRPSGPCQPHGISLFTPVMRNVAEPWILAIKPPTLRRAGFAQAVTLEAGDLLYLPPLWFHHVHAQGFVALPADAPSRLRWLWTIITEVLRLLPDMHHRAHDFVHNVWRTRYNAPLFRVSRRGTLSPAQIAEYQAWGALPSSVLCASPHPTANEARTAQQIAAAWQRMPANTLDLWLGNWVELLIFLLANGDAGLVPPLLETLAVGCRESA
ncbi:uncharacterized protein MONBRDRAFT_34680 [Monosiga brevicollis MX1]|uniref:JmjC domain-containing protein n=1 Tax=Monosiga brevicollis TaxID=81824 RepID=A9VDA9_MONBE|nr:uncharacterized protein MONBRDRAFT_34680 [Monosiga brevicollis MX1]EDQ84524.1 predicted protein [Monosiga brevicollis MX1]|eukprot:XP_001750711.1 hypothetical protein [Monosiga brevicollis MX1]